MYLYLYGERGRRRALEAAAAAVDGKPTTAFEAPSADNVATNRRPTLVRNLKDAAEDKLPALLAALTFDEWLVVTKACDKDKALNARLAPAAGRIVKVTAAAGVGDLGDLRQSLDGGKLSRQTVEKLVDFARRRAKDGKAVSISVNRGPILDGVTIRIAAAGSSRAEKAMPEAQKLRSATSLSAAVMGAGQGFVVADMAVPTNRITTVSAAGVVGAAQANPIFDQAVADMKASLSAEGRLALDAFWKAVDGVAAGEPNACRQSGLHIGPLAAMYGGAGAYYYGMHYSM
jgi:hypothetical protein